VLTRAPPATFPQPQGKIQTITLPEDVYVKRFYKKYPESKYHDPIKYDPFSLCAAVFP
jgi:small subunit ribosomal protein S23